MKTEVLRRSYLSKVTYVTDARIGGCYLFNKE